jgi:RNA 3'-terminal phosphate cyclase (ATP)
LQRSFLPLIARMGAKVELELRSYGFYPRGGGEIVAKITPSELSALTVTERGERVRGYAEAYVAAIPIHVGQRELEVIGKRLKWSQDQLFLRGLANDMGPGNAVTITVEHENVTEVFTGFGERGVRAEDVANKAVDEAREYIASSAAVGEHLADQLLLPMALGHGGSFTTAVVSAHLKSNALIIETFTPRRVTISESTGGFAVRVR